MTRTILAAASLFLLGVPAAAQTNAPAAPASAAAHTAAPSASAAAEPAKPNDYTDPANWLCRPDRADACSTADETATIVNANGSESAEKWAADPKAPVDCFYVYPTVSREPTPNSDMIPGGGEKAVVVHQVARLAARCRIFAPMYRQVTLAALRASSRPVQYRREATTKEPRRVAGARGRGNGMGVSPSSRPSGCTYRLPSCGSFPTG